MAYTKTNWVNNTTPLNATNMNKIEEGIAANDAALNTKASVDYVDKTHYGYSGNDLLIIPEGTTTIGDNAYRGTTYKCVVIPNSVTSISLQSFDHCRFLTSITIPGSVTSIGDYAFSNCGSLTSITIGNGVKSIRSYAFSSCGLTSITIPNSVTIIGNYAFSYCGSLTSITIPNSVKIIGNSAFGYCTSLTSITIGNSVTSIGNSAFISCPLTTIDLTAYTTQSFPTLGTNSFTASDSGCQIKVVKGRKNDLIATSGWSEYANYVVEVPTVETLDTAIAAVKNGYLPLSGGGIISNIYSTSKIEINGSYITVNPEGEREVTITRNQICCNDCDADEVIWALDETGLSFPWRPSPYNGTLSGISDIKGTSPTVAASLKCLSDNYVPFTNCPVLKQNLEIPVSKYSFILENNGDNLIASEKSISINDNMNLHTLSIDSNKITYTDTDITKNWTFAGTIFSTTDLTAGTSALPDNQLYFVYE